MSKEFSCGKTHSDIADVRGCSGCHQNGTAARVHAGLKDSDPVEMMFGETTSAPTASVQAEPQVEPKPQDKEPTRKRSAPRKAAKPAKAKKK